MRRRTRRSARSSRNAKIPGFRPGKAPRKVFENTYGTSRIVERALDDLVPAKYAAAVEEHHLEPLAPTADGTAARETRGSRCGSRRSSPIRPAIEPHDYEGVEITDVPETATDDDVERTLEQMRRDAANLVPADRPVQLGDVVTIDFAGSIDGVPFEGGTAEGQEAEMNESNFVPGFVEGIIGMRAGETKDVAATFPDPYANEELAGKSAVFNVTVHDVKERELPPLDDEFAARVSTSPTLEELRADVKRRLDETVEGQRPPPHVERAARQDRRGQRRSAAGGARRARDRLADRRHRSSTSPGPASVGTTTSRRRARRPMRSAPTIAARPSGA